MADMKFSELSKYLDKLERTSSRNEITEILAGLFKKANSKEIDKIVYLLLGQLAPSYEGVVFNIAERMMLQVISEAYGIDTKRVKILYKKKGDLGNVAQGLAKGKGRGLSVSHVYDRLLKIAMDEGEGSQERKVSETAKLLSGLDPLSARFVARIPVGKLRLGFSDKTIIDALSWMEKGDKSAKPELEKAYHVLPDVGLLAKKVRGIGIEKASKDKKPIVGVPVLPMLAQRLKSPAEMIEKMQSVAVEPKFDGLRIQIHFKVGKRGFTKAYTRNLNETSWMFPELENITKYIHAREVILDSEAIGVDEERRKFANFQQTMTRRRKHEIEKTALKIPIKFYVFDILYKNGKSTMDLPYVSRRKILAKTVKSGRLLQVVDYIVTRIPEDIEKEMSKEVAEGMEGIIIKRTDSKYVPGRTGWRWVKMKEAEKAYAKLADTVDCVVMGTYRGRGKRAEFGVGAFLVGVKTGENFTTVSKIGTGLTDVQWRELYKRTQKLQTSQKPRGYKINKNLKPDTWLMASLVVEIAADEITKSPSHSSGYALRFPRLVKFRDDKSPNQTTTVAEIKRLFELQKN
jgi:DNA ligase-1